MRPRRRSSPGRRAAVDRPRLIAEIVVLLAILVSFAIGVSRVGLQPLSAGEDPYGEEALSAAPPQDPPAPAPAVPAETVRGHAEDETPVSGAEVARVIESLRARRLTIPVTGVTRSQLVSSFDQARGDRRHEALDIMAPRGTPVVAVEDGTVAKLFESKAGGLTLYQFDPAQRVAYYYAHLDRYAEGIEDGQTIRRGDIIGYVGTSGNAAPDAPHLHFAVFVLGPDRRWWEGTPIDPVLVFAEPAGTMD